MKKIITNLIAMSKLFLMLCESRANEWS